MSTISLCMITRNEEGFLERCLNSVKSIVDEIIIADTGSTDSTKDIAKRFNAKVIDIRWGDDFSAARNESLKHATKDWILVLDADETISAGDIERIKKLTEDKKVDGYKLIQRNYSGKGEFADSYEESRGFAGFLPSPLVRLFQNNKGYHFTNIIHEVIEDSIRKMGGNIALADIPIHHLSALKNKEFQEQKDKQYIEMEKKQIRLRPDYPKPYYELGKIHLQKNEFEKSAEYFEKALELLKGCKEKLAIHDFIYLDLGEAYIQLREFEKAKPLIESAISLNPNHISAYFYLGLIYDEKNDIDNAINSYEKAVMINPRAENAYNNLAVLYIKKKEYGKAHNILLKAISLDHPKKKQMQELLKDIEKKLGYSYSVSIG